MDKEIKQTILSSLQASLDIARDFMEQYEINLFNGKHSVNEKIDEEEYKNWTSYRNKILVAYKFIKGMGEC